MEISESGAMGVEELKAILESKDGFVEEQEEIILDTEEEVDENDKDDGQTEIIEIIETIECIDDVEQTDSGPLVSESVDGDSVQSIEDLSNDDNPPKKRRIDSDSQSSLSQQMLTYQVDDDWVLEEHDPLEIRSNRSKDVANKNHANSEKKILTINGTKSTPKQFEDAESPYRVTRSTKTSEYDSADDNSGQEIVKNAENDLVYTVLSTKKSSDSKQRQDDSHYIKMERLDEDTIPEEGTIYYEGDDMGTLYMAQTIDENEQYQYDEQVLEQEDQEQQEHLQQVQWEAGNEDLQLAQEDNENQDQIFLHEDEDGQLYFKDDTGTLQPVYLTEDGNYSFADQTVEDTEIQDPRNAHRSTEMAVSVPDIDSNSLRQGSSIGSEQMIDGENEDDTVTIAMIISEDENGMKRTKVIIPTTDNLKCEICLKSFKTQFQLLRHNRLKHAREEDITTRNFPCDLCPKRFPDQNTLARHRRTHTGDRPFQCLECQQTFPTAPALRRHMTLHNPDTKPQPCIYCGRRFLDKPSLQKHEDSHLGGDQQRAHTCDICGKSFITSADLALHKKNHDPDKKFDCETCGREFNRLNNLQRHMLVHQQVREKSAPQGQNNQEILSCDVCGITYKFMSSLTRHMVTSHMNPEKLRQQAEEQRRKRENNYKRYLENRKMYETQHGSPFGNKRNFRGAMSSDPDDDLA